MRVPDGCGVTRSGMGPISPRFNFRSSPSFYPYCHYLLQPSYFHPMAPARLPCCIRVRKANSSKADSVQAQKSAAFAVGDCPEIGIEIRKQ